MPADFTVNKLGQIIPRSLGQLGQPLAPFADFISGSAGTARGGLPALRPQGGLPALTAQSALNLGPQNALSLGPQNFTLGAGGVGQGPSARPQLALPNLQTAGKAVQGPSTSVPSGPGPKAPPSKPTLTQRAGKLAKGGGGALAVGLLDENLGRDPEAGELSGGRGVGGAVGSAIQGAFDLGQRGEGGIGGPESSRAEDAFRAFTGTLLKAPARITAGVKDIAQDPFGSVKKLQEFNKGIDAKTLSLITDSKVGHELFTPKGQLEDEARAERLAQAEAHKISLQETDRALELAETMGLIPTTSSVTSEQVQNAFTVGLEGRPQLAEIPAPPKPTLDFSEALAGIKANMPQAPDPKDQEQLRSLGVLAGFASGLLGAHDGEGFGRTLLRFGLGGLQGRAGAEQNIKAAEEEFRGQMGKYWRDVATVQQRQSESEDAYANRVWQVEKDNQVLGHKQRLDAWKVSQPTVTQMANGSFGIAETVRDEQDNLSRVQRVWRPNDSANNLARLEKNLKKYITSDSALRVSMSRISSAVQPSLQSAGEAVLGSARANGTEQALIGALGLEEELSQIAREIQLRPGMSPKAQQEAIANSQAGLIIQMIVSSPQVLLMAQDFMQRGIRTQEEGAKYAR